MALGVGDRLGVGTIAALVLVCVAVGVKVTLPETGNGVAVELPDSAWLAVAGWDVLPEDVAS